MSQSGGWGVGVYFDWCITIIVMVGLSLFIRYMTVLGPVYMERGCLG